MRKGEFGAVQGCGGMWARGFFRWSMRSRLVGRDELGMNAGRSAFSEGNEVLNRLGMS